MLTLRRYAIVCLTLLLVLTLIACGGGDNSPSGQSPAVSPAETSSQRTGGSDGQSRDPTPADLPVMILQQEDVPDGFVRVSNESSDTHGGSRAEWTVSYWSPELASHEELTGTTCIEGVIELHDTPESAVGSLSRARESLVGVGTNSAVPDVHSEELPIPTIGDQSFGFLVSGTYESSCSGFKPRTIEQYYVTLRRRQIVASVSVITLDVGIGSAEAVGYAKRQSERMESMLQGSSND